jgi:flagellin-like protein
MKKEDKKGLSPVIATVLLVAIALVLAVIIFLWALSFIGESITKDGSAIELACEHVVFEAEASSTTIDVVNRGNVPIYGLEIRQAGNVGGEVLQFERLPHTIRNGETESIPISSLSGVDEILVVPVLLGESGNYKKEHVCDSDYGEEITVGS